MRFTKKDLKNVIKELISEAVFSWSTAHMKNVPEEVINAGHKIIQVAQRDDPGTHPEFWMSISQRPQLGMGFLSKNLVDPNVWYIDKPGKHNEERYWIVSFNNQTKKWRIVSVKDGHIYKKSEEFADISSIIDWWVRGV